MSNSNYKFVNPHIEGDFKNLFSGKNHIDAARIAWEKLSTNFTNNLPKFAFTLEKVGDGKLYHFLPSQGGIECFPSVCSKYNRLSKNKKVSQVKIKNLA